MSERLRSGQPSVLILADFSDGSWQATSFAMEFLYRKKSSLSILQTYQNPGWGHFMMRKLSHQLKEITKYELKTLENKIVSNFKIEKQEINTLSIEGELNSILNHKAFIKGPHNIVLCTDDTFNDSCARQNRCLEKIINTSNHPLFILPKTFEGETTRTVLFVGNPNRIPSEKLCSQVKEICKKTHSNLEILFVIKNQGQKLPNDVISNYQENFNGLEFTMNHFQNKTKCKGINDYLKNSSRDLIVIEND